VKETTTNLAGLLAAYDTMYPKRIAKDKIAIPKSLGNAYIASAETGKKPHAVNAVRKASSVFAVIPSIGLSKVDFFFWEEEKLISSQSLN